MAYMGYTNNYMNNYQMFPASYFSGADVYLSINGRVFNDVVEIAFDMTENLMPIFGYASYTYDAIAHGTRLIQGKFAINFTSSGSIPAMLDNATANLVGSSLVPSLSVRPFQGANGDTPEDTINWIKGKPKDQVKDLAKSLESQIWGASKPSSNPSSSDTANKQNRPMYTPVGTRLHQRGFDIVINYGSGSIQTSHDSNTLPGAVTILNNCHLFGQAQRIALDNGALLEVYQFIGKDINNSIG